MAGGCFWCTQAIFQKLKGVDTVVSGYAGGELVDPSYDQVSSGSTGHAEAIQVTFDSQVISYELLLEVFFKLHDPTTVDRQGSDMGNQYRSIVFYHNQKQRAVAEETKQTVQADRSKTVVTEVVPYTNFYPAEKHHQNYYQNNHDKTYCQLVIDPKIQKLYKEFGLLLK